MNEYDLTEAIIAIARADTGAGGFVPLADNQDPPLVLWEDLWVDNHPPIGALFVVTAVEGGGAWKRLLCRVQLDMIVKRNQEGLESRMADRLEDIVTVTNLLSEGVDASVRRIARRPLSAMETGRRRLGLELQVNMNR